MDTKICSKGKKILSVDCFHKDKNRKDGLYPVCKDCRKDESKKYYEKNKDIIVEKTKSYYENNKSLIREKSFKYYQEHRENILKVVKQYRENNKEKVYMSKKCSYNKKIDHYKKIRSIWRENNKDIINKKEKEKMENDSLYRLKHLVRCNVYDAFLRKKYKKSKSTEKIVGCDLNFLCEYLENTYYKNYGVEYDGTQKIHIDHIIPLKTAETEEDVIKLCHYTNLQLLNANDNLTKGDKIDFIL